MHGKGVDLLTKSLDILNNQKNINFLDFEVVISDHSKNDDIEKCYKKFNNLNFVYVRNTENHGSMSDNINNCIRHSSGKYIKPLFQDDFLYDETSLSKIINNLQDSWMANEYTHLDLSNNSFYNQRTPSYNEGMKNGENTIGPPSSTIFLNDDNYFDMNLLWFMDTEFYYRMYLKYGLPTILKSSIPLNVVTTWSGQTTSTRITRELIDKEHSYINYKHNDNN